jgi:hypothetical protein
MGNWGTTAMNPSVAAVLGLALAAALTAPAAAQSPWPDPKQPPAQAAPWPSAAPAQSAPAASPWPSAGAPAQAAPGQGASPWPSSPQRSSFPSGGGGAAFGAPPQGAPAAQCQVFPKLRDEAAKKAEIVSEIGKKHGERAAMCGAVTNFFAAELKVVKFLEDNKGPCGVPDQAVQQAKLIHTNTQKFKDQVCAEGPKPKIPTLSDAINTTPVDTKKNTHTGPGTFDTLTGNPLSNN